MTTKKLLPILSIMLLVALLALSTACVQSEPVEAKEPEEIVYTTVWEGEMNFSYPEKSRNNIEKTLSFPGVKANKLTRVTILYYPDAVDAQNRGEAVKQTRVLPATVNDIAIGCIYADMPTVDDKLTIRNEVTGVALFAVPELRGTICKIEQEK